MLVAPPPHPHAPLRHRIRRREPPVPADLHVPALAEIREREQRPRELVLKDGARPLGINTVRLRTNHFGSTVGGAMEKLGVSRIGPPTREAISSTVSPSLVQDILPP